MEIIECKNISDNNKTIVYIRVNPGDLSETINDIINKFFDMSWVDKIENDVIKDSYRKRAMNTARNIKEKIENSDNDNLTRNAGEYVVSELSREAIVEHLKYKDIPLAELFKEKASNNPGFDFYSENEIDKFIVFGEAKYNSSHNAYGIAMSQVDRFIQEGKDLVDVASLQDYVSEDSIKNFNNQLKGYAIAFASKDMNSEIIIKNIKQNPSYNSISLYSETIFIAVNI